MGEVEIVSDLVHLTRYIVTPLIGIDRVPAIDVGVGNAAHCPAGKAVHHVVGKCTGV